MLVLYWSLISLAFTTSDGLLASDGFNNTIAMNDTDLTANETVEDAGLFSTGVSFGRFIGLVFFGIGFPASVPAFIRTIFAVWQTLVTVIGIAWFISSIWDG